MIIMIKSTRIFIIVAIKAIIIIRKNMKHLYTFMEILINNGLIQVLLLDK